MNDKVLVLLSAGLDSTVNLFEAHRDSEVRLALTFDYGQRAARREIERAQSICLGLNIFHKVVELPWIESFTQTALLKKESSLPLGHEVDIESLEQSMVTAEKVWVPNRNGIFLNIAAGFAEGLGAQYVVPGFNAEEALTFPDNTTEFLEVLDQSFHFSTASGVKTRCYTRHMNKSDIVRRGKELGVPFDELWPCYEGGSDWCGLCESCLRFQRARKEGESAEPMDR